MENSETRIEQEVEATNAQHTGNHHPGPDQFGGTRQGANHVEPTPPVAETLDEDLSVNGPAERAPERDERGRL